MRKQNRSKKIIFFSFYSLLAVQPALSNTDIYELTENFNSSLNCIHSRDHIWNSIYKHIEERTFSELKNLSGTINSYDSELSVQGQKLFQLVFKEVPLRLKVKNKEELLEALTALELGDQSTPEKKFLLKNAERIFKKIESRSLKLKLECKNPDEKVLRKKNTAFRSFLATPSDGVLKTLATFYQSCQVLDLAAMTAADPSVEGISVVGTHSDGVGKKRLVSSVTKLNSTSPYLKNISSYADSCVNVKLNPPIYDYGGKPYASSDVNSSLNFFKNAGSGTSAMGIDCSGLVFANLASAGLKLKSSTTLKAISVNGISSTMLSNPSGNGLDCLERVTFKEDLSLQVGDIISKPGHTVSVYSVGSDPFGINSITKVSDCTSSKISSSRYNFSIVQSAPIKGGIGVNRINMRDYLSLQSSWGTGMMFYAIKACKAKFGVYSSSASSDKLAIVRHKGTSACRSQPIALAGETCVQSCGL